MRKTLAALLGAALLTYTFGGIAPFARAETVDVPATIQFPGTVTIDTDALPGIPGPEGPQGPQGLQGPQGPAGADADPAVTDALQQQLDDLAGRVQALEDGAPPSPDPLPPTDIDLSSFDVDEAVSGAVVGTLTVTDPDSSSWTLTVDDPRFEVVGDTLKLTDTSSLDFDTEPTVTVAVTATDPDGLFVSVIFVLDVVEFVPPPSGSVNLLQFAGVSDPAQVTPAQFIQFLRQVEATGQPGFIPVGLYALAGIGGMDQAAPITVACETGAVLDFGFDVDAAFLGVSAPQDWSNCHVTNFKTFAWGGVFVDDDETTGTNFFSARTPMLYGNDIPYLRFTNMTFTNCQSVLFMGSGNYFRMRANAGQDSNKPGDPDGFVDPNEHPRLEEMTATGNTHVGCGGYFVAMTNFGAITVDNVHFSDLDSSRCSPSKRPDCSVMVRTGQNSSAFLQATNGPLTVTNSSLLRLNDTRSGGREIHFIRALAVRDVLVADNHVEDVAEIAGNDSNCEGLFYGKAEDTLITRNVVVNTCRYGEGLVISSKSGGGSYSVVVTDIGAVTNAEAFRTSSGRNVIVDDNDFYAGPNNDLVDGGTEGKTGVVKAPSCSAPACAVTNNRFHGFPADWPMAQPGGSGGKLINTYSVESVGVSGNTRD